jgi:hypothetical protein
LTSKLCHFVKKAIWNLHTKFKMKLRRHFWSTRQSKSFKTLMLCLNFYFLQDCLMPSLNFYLRQYCLDSVWMWRLVNDASSMTPRQWRLVNFASISRQFRVNFASISLQSLTATDSSCFRVFLTKSQGWRLLSDVKKFKIGLRTRVRIPPGYMVFEGNYSNAYYWLKIYRLCAYLRNNGIGQKTILKQDLSAGL